MKNDLVIVLSLEGVNFSKIELFSKHRNARALREALENYEITHRY